MASITVRRPSFDLAGLPRRWVGGSALGTWFGNAGHVFIPIGERFFIDSVKAFRDRIDDDSLRAEVSAFIGQESVHSRAHEAVWEELRSHGVPVDRYAALVRGVQETLSPLVSAELQLATTAALEHYTAAYGCAFLAEDLDPVVGEEMAALLRWHGGEEVEHRSVAFDVLEAVDGTWTLRLAGLGLGTALLAVVPLAGVVMFAVEDLRRGDLGLPRRPDGRLVAMSARFARRVTREVGRYVQPGFHPDREPEPDDYHQWVAAAAM